MTVRKIKNGLSHTKDPIKHGKPIDRDLTKQSSGPAGWGWFKLVTQSESRWKTSCSMGMGFQLATLHSLVNMILSELRLWLRTLIFCLGAVWSNNTWLQISSNRLLRSISIPNQSTAVDSCGLFRFPVYHCPRLSPGLLIIWRLRDLRTPLYVASKEGGRSESTQQSNEFGNSSEPFPDKVFRRLNFISDAIFFRWFFSHCLGSDGCFWLVWEAGGWFRIPVCFLVTLHGWTRWEDYWAVSRGLWPAFEASVRIPIWGDRYRRIAWKKVIPFTNRSVSWKNSQISNSGCDFHVICIFVPMWCLLIL